MLVACKAGASGRGPVTGVCFLRSRSNRELTETGAQQRQFWQHGCVKEHAFATSVTMSQRAGPGNTRKRGHQHHPRNNGTRGRRTTLEPATINSNTNITTNENNVTLTDSTTAPKSVILSASVSSAFDDSLVNKSKSDIIDLTNCDDEEVISKPEETFLLTKTSKEEQNSRIRKHARNNNKNNAKDMSLIYRPAAEGSSQSDQEGEDAEIEELAKLRCPSERTEVVAERETRRRNRRCADYPGLAFGSSIFSSDTLMKFSIIRNELHNIMNTQLKRVRFTQLFPCHGVFLANHQQYGPIFRKVEFSNPSLFVITWF